MVENLKRLADIIERHTTPKDNYRKGAQHIRQLAQRLGKRGFLPDSVEDFEMQESIYVYHHPLFDFDRHRYCLLIEGTEVELTPTEFKIMSLFTDNPNIVLTHNYIEDKIWPDESDVDIDQNHAIKIHVRNLRIKIKNGREIKNPIENRRGQGYILNDPDKLSHVR